MMVGYAARILSVNTKTVRSFYKALRQCMAEDLLENGAILTIGGKDHVIEIAKLKFGKRKYNSGGRVVLQDNCKCFLVECSENRRNHHRLIRWMKQNVATGTTILTDIWKGYNALYRYGYNNLVVDHQRGFFNSVSG